MLSLTGKALTRQPPEPDTRLFTETVRHRLEAKGFAIDTATRLSGVYLFGARGACRVMITEQDAMGAAVNRNRQFARDIGPLRVVWRGQLHDTPPRWRIVSRFLVRRELVRVGLDPARDPVAAVAFTSACSPSEVAALPPRTLPR